MDNDPAADFLAREQQQLADLDEIDSVRTNETPQYRQNGHAVDIFDDDLGNTASGVVNDDDFMILGGNETSNLQNGDMNDIAKGRRDSDDRDTSTSFRAPISSTTPESVRKWREEQSARLKSKDKAEEEKNHELREQAQKELDDWYRLWNDNFEKRKKANRENEKSISEANSGDFGNSDDPKQVWERIATLCDFGSSQKATASVAAIPGVANPATANKTEASTRDVSRMKTLLLQLKQKPPKQSSDST